MKFSIKHFYFNLIIKAIKAIDEVGYLTNVRYSQVNKHHTFNELKELELKMRLKSTEDGKELNEEKKI